MRRPSNSYWDRRALARMAAYHRDSDETVGQITAAYDKALADIEASIERIFLRFAANGELSATEARQLLNEPITRGEWEEIKAQYLKARDPEIRRRLLAYLNAPAYAARITRLQALKADIYVKSKLIADVEIELSSQAYIDTINAAYYRSMFDLQRGLGIGFDFAAMSVEKAEQILRRPWSGQHFSRRIWDNTDVLARELSDVMAAGFRSGAGVRKMREELADRMDVGKHAANRIVRTETTYMANAAEMETYEEAEIDKYQFLATLDSRTSPQCRQHDLKIYAVKDARPGRNMPPLHPYCRSTTVAHFGDAELDNLERRARDPVTGKTQIVSAGINYEQWLSQYKKG